VAITGEVYFEVAKIKQQPFKVKINLREGEGGEVEVLGTHFNINAYDDETDVRTTLFEGSVSVNQSTGVTQIKPGQQLQSNKAGQVKIINDADLEAVIAWKEGRFQFEGADINTVMRQLARWYDINVEYKERITPHFGGTISRNVNILKVLEMLELTGEVKFKVEDRKVIVMHGKN
jgi:ferric-dicitrate binding protein FerR (iron transport regulator)